MHKIKFTVCMAQNECAQSLNKCTTHACPYQSKSCENKMESLKKGSFSEVACLKVPH